MIRNRDLWPLIDHVTSHKTNVLLNGFFLLLFFSFQFSLLAIFYSTRHSFWDLFDVCEKYSQNFACFDLTSLLSR